MSAPDAHPPEGTLADFLLGRLADGDQLALEGHLSGCPECLARAAAARPNDTLAELVAAAGTHLDAERAAARTPSLTEAGTGSPFAPTYLWSDGTAPGAECDPPATLVDHPKYRVRQALGHGGMGSVWLAEHAVMNRPVAVKVIRPELLSRPGAAARFLREVRAAAKLHHPNIVTAFDAEQVGDSCLLVMEFIDGPTLAELAREGPLPVAEACRAVRDAARGLAHAHAAGLVHRDIKPHNLMRTADGTVKVLDFGLAGVAAGDEVASAGGALTGAGMVFGTPDYIAPEQIADPHAADPRADVYALGCTLFHLLAGRAPFAGNTPLVKLDLHRNPDAVPQPPVHVPPGLFAVLAQMMAKQPSDRYQTADAVAAALEPFARAALAKPPGRKRWAVAAGLAVLFGGLAAAGTGWVIVRDKDGKEVARVQVPDGGKVEVAPLPPADGPQPPRPKPTAEDAIVLKGHAERVRQVAFGPDAKVVYSASDDKTVRAWDRGTGRELRRFDHPTRVLSLALLDGGNALVTLTDRQLRVWDTATGKELEPFTALDPKEGNRLSFVAPSPDGKRLATGSIGGEVRVWDVAARKVLRRWPGQGGQPTYYVAWSPDGKRLAAGTWRTVNVWDAGTGERVFGFPHAFDLMQLVYSPDGRALAVGDERGTVLLLSAATGEVQKTFQTRPDDQFGGHHLAAAPGNRFVAAGLSPTVALYDASGRRLQAFPGHTTVAYGIAVSADARWLAAGAEDGTVRVFPFPPAPADLTKPGVLQYQPPDGRPVHSAQIDPDGRTFLVSRGDRTELFDTATGAKLHAFPGHLGYYALGGTKVLCAGPNNRLALYDRATGKLDRTFGLFKADIWQICPIGPDAARVLVAVGDRTFRLFDVARGEQLLSTEYKGEPLFTVSADGKAVLIREPSDTAYKVFDAATGKPVKGFEAVSRRALLGPFSADGTQAQSWDGKETRIVRVSDGEVLGTYPAHPDGAVGVGYTPDRTSTLVYRANGELQLRDSITGGVLSALKVEFPGRRDRLLYLNMAAVSSDGTFALLASTDGHVAAVRLPDPKPNP